MVQALEALAALWLWTDSRRIQPSRFHVVAHRRFMFEHRSSTGLLVQGLASG